MLFCLGDTNMFSVIRETPQSALTSEFYNFNTILIDVVILLLAVVRDK
jgi:hypothetical protein